jgi:transposase
MRYKEKLEKLQSEMAKLAAIEKQVLASPDKQVSFTDPDSRSIATSGRGSGVVGYNEGREDRCRLRSGLLQRRGDQGVRGRRRHRDVAETDDIRCQSGRPFRQAGFCVSGWGGCLPLPGRGTTHLSNDERGKRPEDAPVLDKCVPSLSAQGEMHERPGAADRPLEHEQVVEAVQERLDKNPEAMRTRRETVEHRFGTLKMRMGATHFLCKTLPKVATEMALCVLGYNMTRVLNIVGVKPLLAAIAA